MDDEPQIEQRYRNMTGRQLDEDHAAMPDVASMSAQYEGMGLCAVCHTEAGQEGPDPRRWEHADYERDDQFGPGPLWSDLLGLRGPFDLDEKAGRA